MPKLILKRKSEWINRMREIAIYLNDEKVGGMDNGSSLELELPPGEHTLKAKIDWCGSKSLHFTLAENEKKSIELAGFRSAWWMMPLLIFVNLGYFVFGDVLNLDPWVYFGIILIPVLKLVYHLTWGRNKYLRFNLQ